MKISKLAEVLNAELFCGSDLCEEDVSSAFASDMMSDVLAYAKTQDILLTGLCNPQAVRTAVMLDMKCVVLVRGKTPSSEMVELAKSNGIALLASKLKCFSLHIYVRKRHSVGEYSE